MMTFGADSGPSDGNETVTFDDPTTTAPMIETPVESGAVLVDLSDLERDDGRVERAMESLNAVNAEIAGLVHQSWGR